MLEEILLKIEKWCVHCVILQYALDAEMTGMVGLHLVMLLWWRNLGKTKLLNSVLLAEPKFKETKAATTWLVYFVVMNGAGFAVDSAVEITGIL